MSTWNTFAEVPENHHHFCCYCRGCNLTSAPWVPPRLTSLVTSQMQPAPENTPGTLRNTCSSHRARAVQVMHPTWPPSSPVCHISLSAVGYNIIQLVFFREATSFPILSPEEGRKSTSNSLSRWLTYVCWLLLGVTSLAAAFFTALHSLELNKEQATSWVISMILSVLQNVFIIQPAKVHEQWVPPVFKECVKLQGAWGTEAHGYWCKVPNGSDNLTKKESSPQKK